MKKLAMGAEIKLCAVIFAIYICCYICKIAIYIIKTAKLHEDTNTQIRSILTKLQLLFLFLSFNSQRASNAIKQK